ncbi:hypothetical protein PRIPAC_97824 [Pristionchus pacificus]|uniref:RING-type domain-containing protein n=1 Tax=Pristionchus pacificus TaxID=54126 RepID=A0A2A6D260_PRIPA|nr:hypothetical protein PRIPAC_97824 [Pristionchus pacificus]|eukprot:PDM84488.1 hypothetical protein PRIPAC_33511 [Pristionchus pacificus]
MAPRTKAQQKSAKPVKKGTKKRRSAKAVKQVQKNEVVREEETVEEMQEEVEEEAVEEEERCGICFDGISKMRKIRFSPCNHQLHRKCGMDYLEKLPHPRAQICPYCRMHVEIIHIDASYSIPISNVMCYGDSGMPTKRLVLEHAQWTATANEDIGHLIWLLISRSVCVRNDLVSEGDGGIGLSSRDRIQEKREYRAKCETMEKRITMLRQMEQLWIAGGMNVEELLMKNIDEEFNFKKEMDRCKRLKGAIKLSESRRYRIV